MPEFELHWHGLTCCEVRVNRSLEPALFRALGAAAKRIRESDRTCTAVSAYQSIAVYWPDLVNDPDAEGKWIERIVRGCVQDLLTAHDLSPAGSDKTNRAVVTHELEVCYNGDDLDFVAQQAGMSVQEVIAIHSSTEYTVAAIGFLPNFAYLWGLDQRLATPRKSKPRVRVPAGAVGIGGNQTGVYPRQSPGGWQLIGSVNPAVLNEQSANFEIGDTVRMKAVR